MKKFLVIALAMITVLSLTLFTACKFGNEPKQSDEQSTPQESSTILPEESGGEPTSSIEPGDSTEPGESGEPGDSTEPGESGETSSSGEIEPVVLPAYAAPGFAAGSEGITFTHESAESFYFMMDEGEWQQGASIAYSETLGEHTVTAYVAADEEHEQSEVAQFTYETKATDLTIEKANDLTGTIVFEGAKLQVKEGEAFVDTEKTFYEETESKTYTFKAVGGWNATAAAYYIGETEKTFDFVKAAQSAYTVENFDDITDGILQEEWDVKKYSNDNNWVATTATMTVAQSYTGSDCAQLSCWNNYTRFRFAKSYEVADGYNMITFDFKGDGISELTISLKDNDTGIYLNINLGKTENAWCHYEVSMADEGWKVYYNGTGYDVDEAISFMGSQIGVTSRSQIIAYCDTLSFLTYGETKEGYSTKLYLDEIEFDNYATPETDITQPLFNLGFYYVPNAESGLVFYVDINSYGTIATLTTVSLEENISMEMDIAISGSDITLTDRSGNSLLTLEGKFKENGRVIALTGATGAYAQYIDTSVQYAVAANTKIDFEDGTIGSQYSSAMWTQEKYESTGWKVTTGQMNCRQKGANNNKVVNMATGNSTTGKWTYNLDGNALGLANYFAVDLGNYFSGAKEIKLKLAVKDTSNNTYYLMGGADSFYTFPVTTDMVTLEQWLDAPINIKSFYVVVENKSGINQYLYNDNFTVKYTFEKEPEPVQEPVTTEVLKLDFEDGAGTGGYTNSKWTQYRWDNSAYVAASGKMNSRTNGSKIVNMYGGWTTYKYIYNEGGSALGTANGLSVRVGNYYVADKAIKIRVAVVTENGDEIYLWGEKSAFYSMPYTGANTMITVSASFETASIKSIMVFVRYESGDNYLYVDDITLTYTA